MLPSVQVRRKKIVGKNLLAGASIGMLVGGMSGSPQGLVLAGTTGGLLGGLWGVLKAPRIRKW